MPTVNQLIRRRRQKVSRKPQAVALQRSFNVLKNRPVTSMPLVNRTRAILRIAELGFLGVLVVTLVQTPRLNGEGK